MNEAHGGSWYRGLETFLCNHIYLGLCLVHKTALSLFEHVALRCLKTTDHQNMISLAAQR